MSQKNLGSVAHSTSLTGRLDKHFIACAAVAAAGAAVATQDAQGSIVWSGNVNVPIPNSGTGAQAGVYVDIFNLITQNSFFSGFDVNFFANNRSDGTKAFSVYVGLQGGTPVAQMVTVPASTGLVDNLAAASSISAASNFSAGYQSGQYFFMGYSSTSGPLALPWVANGTSGYTGFRFRDPSDVMHYGWARLTINSNYSAVLHEYAYETGANTAIGAGVVPEPASAALAFLALGAMGVRPTKRFAKSA